MKILVTGSSGLIGSELVTFLETAHHEVVRFRRARTGMPAAPPRIDEELDAVVHLGGEPIAGRWTDRKKRRIRESRVNGTRQLCEALVKLRQPPRVLVSASAIGYYGNRGAELLNEDSQPGDDFLANVCREWEAATSTAAEAGIRVVNLRFGVVLSAQGGALKKMLLPFKLGAGGIVGDGKQFWSWVAIDDVVGAIHHAIVTDRACGPMNVVSPNPVTNREFTKTLGRVLRRPTIIPMPAIAARIVFGEMADGLLLCSARVQPIRLKGNGYRFNFADLEPTLRHLLAGRR
jgi:uncharacterized protein